MKNKDFLEKCWTVVQQQEKPILIVETLKDYFEAYLVESFRNKSRDVFQNDVLGAQEITDLIESVEFLPSNNNKLSMESKINSRPKKDFSFGHDSFLLLKTIQKNEY